MAGGALSDVSKELPRAGFRVSASKVYQEGSRLPLKAGANIYLRRHQLVGPLGASDTRIARPICIRSSANKPAFEEPNANRDY